MGPLSPFLLSHPGPLRFCSDRCPPEAVHLWSTGLAACRRANMPQCSLSALVRLPEARKRVVQAASLMRAWKLAADREAAEDDLLWSSRGTAELGRPGAIVRAKL